MIDSIELRLHSLEKYPNLFKFLVKESKKSPDGLNIVDDVREIDMREEISPYKLFLPIREYHRGNSFSRDSKRTVFIGGKVMTSSHYNLGFSIPQGENALWIDFNFSIPKLLFGTNVLQFVQHKTEVRNTDTRFGIHHNSKSRFNANATYDRLVKVIDNFLYRLNNFKWVDLKDVQIKRIDICWNQIFHSKEDALRYQSYQLEVRKKYSRNDATKPRSFGTTVFWNTRDYGAKIYHKGNEYRCSTGERKEHLRINKEEGKQIFDVDTIGGFADRILRYEITFRNAYLSKIYRAKIFRRNDARHMGMMKRYKELERIFEYAHSKTLSREKREQYYDRWQGYHYSILQTCEHCKHLLSRGMKAEQDCIRCKWKKEPVFYRRKDGTKHQVTKEDRDFYHWWSKVSARRIHFYLGVNPSLEDLNTGADVLTDEKTGRDAIPLMAKFDRQLLKECFDIFFDFKKEFRVDTKTSIVEADEKLKEFNDRVDTSNSFLSHGETKKKKVNISSLKKVFGLLENHSFEELVKRGFFTRQSAWRYKKIMDELGLNLKGGSDVTIKSCHSFQEYHRELLLNPELSKYTMRSTFFH